MTSKNPDNLFDWKNLAKAQYETINTSRQTISIQAAHIEILQKTVDSLCDQLIAVRQKQP